MTRGRYVITRTAACRYPKITINFRLTFNMHQPNKVQSDQPAMDASLTDVLAAASRTSLRRGRYFQLPKMLRAYFSSRFPRLLGLWFAIFLAAPLVNAAVGILSKNPSRHVLDASGFAEFADARLLIALGLGTVVVQFLHRLLKRTITIDESEADWGESTVDAVMDEISAAATHFSCILLAGWAFTSVNAMQVHWDYNLVLALLSVAVAVYTFDARANYPKFAQPVPEEFEARLLTPVEDAAFKAGASTVFSGSFYKRPPKGYEVWLVRRWSENAGEFYPVAKLELSKTSDSNFLFSVTAEVWGAAGDHRFFELWLVGPQGTAVFEAWSNGNDRFVKLQKEIKWDQRFLYPGLVKMTDDMVIVFSRTRLVIRHAPNGSATVTSATAAFVVPVASGTPVVTTGPAAPAG